MATSIPFQFRRHHYLAKFRPGFTVMWLLIFCLMCYLGVWQLHRYHFKKTLLADFQQRASVAPQPLSAAHDVQFQHVSAKGKYLNELSILVDRVHDNRSGFDVVTPFLLEEQNKLLLVNRGWVAASPHFEKEQTTQEITGVIKLINEYQFILGKNVLDQSPLHLQKIDLRDISQQLHEEVFPFILLLDASSAQGYQRDWVITAGMTPERHMGYAVQWFVMAIVLVVAWLCFSIERVELNNNASAK